MRSASSPGSRWPWSGTPWGSARGSPGRSAGPLLDAVGVVRGRLRRPQLPPRPRLRPRPLPRRLPLAGAVHRAADRRPRSPGGAPRPAFSPSRRFVWLGLRSYSFYLWHWPVLVLTRPGIDVSMPRGVLIPLQLLAVLALSDLSYRYVERPFATGGRLAEAAAGLGQADQAGAGGGGAGRRRPDRLERAGPGRDRSPRPGRGRRIDPGVRRGPSQLPPAPAEGRRGVCRRRRLDRQLPGRVCQ